MRIAIDAMGGDNAPGEIISGALEATELLEKNDEVILVGPKEIVEPRVPSKFRKSAVTIVDAPEVISMDEAPIESIRNKRNSSIAVMAKMAKEGQADAVISAGNTGPVS